MELKNGTARQWLSTAGDNALVALAGKPDSVYDHFLRFLCMLMNTILFKFVGVPLNGSVPLLFASGLVFVLAYQAIGVAISALLSNLRLSLSIGGGYSVLAFTFSGLTFPFLAMDLPVRIIGYVFPLTHYVDIFIDQAMRGAPPVYTINYLGYMSVFILLPVVLLPRLKRICTDEKYWGGCSHGFIEIQNKIPGVRRYPASRIPLYFSRRRGAAGRGRSDPDLFDGLFVRL